MKNTESNEMGFYPINDYLCERGSTSSAEEITNIKVKG